MPFALVYPWFYIFFSSMPCTLRYALRCISKKTNVQMVWLWRMLVNVDHEIIAVNWKGMRERTVRV